MCPSLLLVLSLTTECYDHHQPPPLLRTCAQHPSPQRQRQQKTRASSCTAAPLLSLPRLPVGRAILDGWANHGRAAQRLTTTTRALARWGVLAGDPPRLRPLLCSRPLLAAAMADSPNTHTDRRNHRGTCMQSAVTTMATLYTAYAHSQAPLEPSSPALSS